MHKLGYSAFTKTAEVDKVEGALAIVDAKSLYDLLANETGGGADRRTENGFGCPDVERGAWRASWKGEVDRPCTHDCRLLDEEARKN